MIYEIELSTISRSEFRDITAEVQGVVSSSKTEDGICFIFVPHTTAGITINENADPSVARDILKGLDSMAPSHHRYEHSEGNSDSHIKAAMIGGDKIVLIEKGRLRLGKWQGIFFCEFDGPRRRSVLIHIKDS